MSKYNVGLKTLFLQGLLEPEFMLKFRNIIGRNGFPYHFKKIIIVRYRKIGYNILFCDTLHAWLFIQSR